MIMEEAVENQAEFHIVIFSVSGDRLTCKFSSWFESSDQLLHVHNYVQENTMITIIYRGIWRIW